MEYLGGGSALDLVRCRPQPWAACQAGPQDRLTRGPDSAPGPPPRALGSWGSLLHCLGASASVGGCLQSPRLMLRGPGPLLACGAQVGLAPLDTRAQECGSTLSSSTFLAKAMVAFVL